MENRAETLFIHNATQLVTVYGPDRARGGDAQGQIDTIEDGAVYCKAGKIIAAGITSDVIARYPGAESANTKINAAGHAVIPGLVDCHAHPVFAGDRSNEYAERLAGKSYREILNSGGGILKTVRHTRMATHEELETSLHERLDAALAHGTTTMEAKTGYGLEEETERKMLEVIREVGTGRNRHAIDLIPTLLYAHAVPKDVTTEEMVTASVRATKRLAPLAEFVDVFCEKGIFDVAQARAVLRAGQRAGLKAKVHADEMCLLGGAKLAAELGAITADHLLFTDDESIAAMKEAGTIAVLLPGTPFVLRIPYADARRFIKAGVPVAVGSDFNPNCFCESLPFAFALAVYEMKMTPAEALVAVTINAAAALNRENEIGSLAPGKRADIVILKGPSYLYLGYQVGGNPVKTVVKTGKVVKM